LFNIGFLNGVKSRDHLNAFNGAVTLPFRQMKSREEKKVARQIR